MEEKQKVVVGAKNRSHRQLLQEERYVWMARAFVMMTVLGILANILLLIAISGAVPFLRVQPFFLDIRSRDEQLISVERLSVEQLNERNLQATFCGCVIHVRRISPAQTGSEGNVVFRWCWISL